MAQEWYFVRRLPPQEDAESPERIEIQLLNDDGQAVATVRLRDDQRDAVLHGQPLPAAVVRAAKARLAGNGDYVGPDGASVPAF